MARLSTVRCLGFLVPLALAASAHAGIWAYDVFKNNYYVQTSADTAPTSAYEFRAAARIQYDAPDAVESVLVTFTGSGSPLALDYFNNQSVAFSPAYATSAERDAAFPTGPYTFTVTGGFFDGQSGSLDLPEPLFTPNVPYFTGTTFDDLQALDASQDFTATINTFPPVEGADIAHTFIAVYGPTGQTVWLADFENSQSTFVIPAGSLSADTSYTITIFFSSRTVAPGDFPFTFAYAGFDQITQASLVTIPGAPAACNLADITEVGGLPDAPGSPDGQLTVDDVIVFVNLFSDGTGCPGTGPCSLADLCGIGGPPELPDGELTVDDVIAFFNAFADGC